MPLPLPVIGIAKLAWKWREPIAISLAAIMLVWGFMLYRHSLIERGREEGKAEQIALYEAAEAKATAEHNARISKLNEDHHAASKDLEGRLQAALSRPPAVRVVRVQNGAACPAPVATDAGEPAAADPGSGPVGEGEADYRVLRDEILRLGADGERFRKMALDAQKGWPK